MGGGGVCVVDVGDDDGWLGVLVLWVIVVDDVCVLDGVAGGGVPPVSVLGVEVAAGGVEVEITVGVIGDVHNTVSSSVSPVPVFVPVPLPVLVLFPDETKACT